MAEDFDPNLWIVHYGPAEPQNRIPVQQVRVHPEVQLRMNERAFIESKGPLQRKEFMLYDQSQWPTVNFGAQMQHQMPPRAAQFYQPPPGADDPRVKRPRVEAPAGPVLGRQRGPSMGVQYDASIEDEENIQWGDYLDHLTPREISTLRYKQHHEWFEEIFSSVYATSQILPEDLGLGFVEELEGLPQGMLEAPGVQSEKSADKQAVVRAEDSARSHQKLNKEQMDELDKRITEYLEKGQAEIRALKAEHAKKVQDPKRNTYRMAERKLREAGRLPDSMTAVNEIVGQVETELNVSIVQKKDFTCVDKGGLEEEKKVAPPPPATNGTNGDVNGDVNGVNGNGLFNGMESDSNGIGTNDNSAAGLLDQFVTGSYENTPRSDGPRISTPQIPPGPSATGTPVAGTGTADTEPQNDFDMHEDDTGLDNPPDDSGLDFLEGMDLDAPLDTGSGGDEAPDDKPAPAEDDWVMVSEGHEAGAAAPSAGAATDAAPAPAAVEPEQARSGAALSAPAAEPSPAPAAPDDEPPPADADDDIFGDITGGGADDFNEFGLDDDEGYGGDGAGAADADDDLALDLDAGSFADAFRATDLENVGRGAEGEDDGV